jgi:serine/threonine protein phosphatase PrpC
VWADTQHGLLLGVFDGHGGDEVADYAARVVRRTFVLVRRTPIDKVLEPLFEHLDYDADAGACATLVLLTERGPRGSVAAERSGSGGVASTT